MYVNFLLFSQNKDSPATFQNDVTHWWDGSQLYGSDVETNAKLRSFKHGKMEVDENDGLLPLDPKTGIDKTGEFGFWPASPFNQTLRIFLKKILE